MAQWKMKGAPSAAPDNSSLTPDSFMATQTPTAGASLTPDSFMAQQSSQPSAWQVLTQPTDKTDQEYLRYKGAAGVAGATIKGLDDVARGTEGAVKGIWDDLSSGHVPLVHSAREGLANAVKSVPQLPGAVRDINASPDPTGTYLNAAQDTAAQGAGQALTALATAGVGKVATEAAPYVAPVGKALVKGYVKKLIPGEVNTAYNAVKTAKASAPPPPTYPGAPLPDNPSVFPGAPLPETPPSEVLQAQPLAMGAQPVPASPAAALGKIPAPWRMKPLPEGFQPAGPQYEPPIGTVGNPGPGPAPWRMKTQADALGEVQTPATQPAAQSGEALSQVPIAPWRMKPQAAALGDTPTTPATARQFTNKVGPMIDESLGNPPAAKPAVTPGQPIYRRTAASTPAAPAEGSVPTPNIPEGHTPVEGSSAVRSFKYDPDAQELHIAPTKGYTYVYGDVSPDQATNFQNAESQGRAWGEIRNSNPLVAKIHENGTRVAMKPSAAASGDDLTGVLQQSVEAAQKAKWKMKPAQ